MSEDKARPSIDTVYGRVDAQTLETLQDEFDTRTLLDLVDQVDELRRRICDPDGLRADLLKLHAMAHTLINGASMSASSDATNIWEVADDLVFELQSIADHAQEAADKIQALADLAPKDEEDS